jgi:hypothetical protein
MSSPEDRLTAHRAGQPPVVKAKWSTLVPLSPEEDAEVAQIQSLTDRLTRVA